MDENNQNNNQVNTQNEAAVQQAVTNALQEQKKKKKRKKLIIFGILVVVIIAVVAATSGSSDDDGESASDGQPTSQSAETKVEPGETITIDDELKITYKKCNTDFKDYWEYSKPSDGKKVISATFTVENVSDSDQYIDTITCYADNEKCDSFIGVDDYDNPFFNSISPGRTVSGSVYFEVDKDAKDIELEFENNVWTEEKTIFVVK